MNRIIAIALLSAAASATSAAELLAQEIPRRRQQPIEIRGQVPTPQVVTVRPRAVPAYSRQVLVPNYYDRDFWPGILAGYELVTSRNLYGDPVLDSLIAATDSLVPLYQRYFEEVAGSVELNGRVRPVTDTARQQARPDTLRRVVPPDTVQRFAPPDTVQRLAPPDTVRVVPPDTGRVTPDTTGREGEPPRRR